MLRTEAATAQGGLCKYCQEPLRPETISADHIRPRIRGGTTERDNINAACRDCNQAKGSMSVGAFLRAIKSPWPGAPFPIWLAFMRRRIWVRTHRACDRIARAAGLEGAR